MGFYAVSKICIIILILIFSFLQYFAGNFASCLFQKVFIASKKYKCVRYKKWALKRLEVECVSVAGIQNLHTLLSKTEQQKLVRWGKNVFWWVYLEKEERYVQHALYFNSYTHMWKIELAVNKKGQMLFCMKKKSMKKLSFCRGYLHYHNCHLHDLFFYFIPIPTHCRFM